MTAYRIAAQSRSFAQPLKKALHTAAAVGCDGVQIDARHELRGEELSQTGLRELRKILADLNLRVGSLTFPTRRSFSDPEDLDRRVEASVAALNLASRLGARVLVLHLGPIPDDAQSSQASLLKDVIGTLAPHGVRLGVKIAGQATFASCAQFADFLASLPEGSLFLDMHPVQLMAAGHFPVEYVSVLGQYITHVHAADAVKNFATSKYEEVELGRGSTDFPALLGHLEEFEFRDWITIERIPAETSAEAIANAVRFLRAV